MNKRPVFSTADAIVACLESLGVSHVFGVPGGPLVELFNSLRTSSIGTILSTSETAAGFSANGYFRSSGRVGVFIAIAGPGVAWSISPLAESLLDSAAVVLLTTMPPQRGKAFDLQYINQQELLQGLGIHVIDVGSAGQVEPGLVEAWRASQVNGPRPVVVQFNAELLYADWSRPRPEPGIARDRGEAGEFGEVFRRIGMAKRPLIIAGGGTLGNSKELTAFAEASRAVVMTTPTARGVLPEDGSRNLGVDLLVDDVTVVNRLINSADLVIALGCRFSHNGTSGFGVELPPEKLIHIDLDADVLMANYPAGEAVAADVGAFFEAAEKAMAVSGRSEAGWSMGEIDNWRNEFLGSRRLPIIEPVWRNHGSMADLFGRICDALPADTVIVTDTGIHQIVCRAHVKVHRPRGLVCPTDFQSMGFGLPAAVGAALGGGGRPVIALIGDGGFHMVGAELLTAKREGLSIPVLIFNDGFLGQIRQQQIQNFGCEASTRLEIVDFGSIAKAYGVPHQIAGQDITSQIRRAMRGKGPSIIEIEIEDGPDIDVVRRRMNRKNRAKDLLGPGGMRLLKRIRR